MSNRAKVIFIPADQLERLLRGALAGVRNFPGDGFIAAIQQAKVDGEPGFAFRVHSSTYPALEHGAQLPVVQATFYSRGES